MQPINYQIDVATPFQAAAQGYQLGTAMRDDQLKQEQLVAAQQQQAQQRQVIQGLISNRNAGAREYADAVLLVPQLREQLKQSWDQKNTAQQESTLKDAGQWYAALMSNRPDIATQAMNERAEAMEASGADPEEVAALRTQAKLVEANPEFARTLAGLALASIPGGDKVLTSAAGIGAERRLEAKAPAELREAEAKAGSAESKAAVDAAAVPFAPTVAKAGADKAVADASAAQTTAKFAERKALADLEKAGWDVKAIQEDIEYKRQANRIAAMNATAAREGNALKKQELQLKIDEAREKLNTTIREKVATAEAGAGTIDNMLNTIQRIEGNKALDDVIGSYEGRPFYPTQLAAFATKAANLLNPLYTPTSGDDRADAQALIETLGSQAFLSQISQIKGMGALSNAEGEKLQAALANFKTAQSEKQFRATLNETSRLLKKARENISRKTGVPLPKPDTPAAPGARPPLASFQK